MKLSQEVHDALKKLKDTIGSAIDAVYEFSENPPQGVPLAVLSEIWLFTGYEDLHREICEILGRVEVGDGKIESEITVAESNYPGVGLIDGMFVCQHCKKPIFSAAFNWDTKGLGCSHCLEALPIDENELGRIMCANQQTKFESEKEEE